MDIKEINVIKDGIQNEAIDVWFDCGSIGTLHMYTGSGKNFCFFKSLYKLWPKGEKLANIWFCSEAEIRQYDVKADMIKFKELYKKDIAKDFPKITYHLYQSLYKLKGESIEYVCLDEIHDLLTPERVAFLQNNAIRYRLGLTATPGLEKIVKEGYKKQHYYDKYCPIIYRCLVEDAIDLGIYAKLKINIVYHDLDNKIKHKMFAKNAYGDGTITEQAYYTYFDRKYVNAVGKMNKKTWAIQRSRSLAKIPSRIEFCKKIVSIMESRNQKTLIFGNSLESLALITDNVVRGTKDDRSHKDANTALRYGFDNNLIKTIASFKILQQGANLTSMDNLILHSNFADIDKFLQRIGRVRLTEKTVEVVIFVARKTVEEDRVIDFVTPFKMVKAFKSYDEYLTYLQSQN